MIRERRPEHSENLSIKINPMGYWWLWRC